MKELARKSHPNTNHSLGLHIRWSDKADGRKLITVDQFLPYVKAFVKNGGQDIYLATDSENVLQTIEKEWPSDIHQRIRRQVDVVRSSNTTAVFKMGFSQHRTNTEVLTDILSLSRCTFLVHGLSAVSDAAMYLNADLIDQSVDLEDPDHMTVSSFEMLVSTVIKAGKVISKPRDWWNPKLALPPLTGRMPTHQACKGYAGILHISKSGVDAAVGMTFFHFVLNQLIYADTHNLKPWIHLSNSTYKIWDQRVHGVGPVVKFTMKTNMEASVETNARLNASFCPSVLRVDDKRSMDGDISVEGTGVWEHYLEQVSDFVPSDASCRNRHFVTLDYKMLVPGIHLHCRWACRSWRYDELPPWTALVEATKYQEWLEPMRMRAHEVVSKYFRFRPHLWQRANSVLYGNGPIVPCLGLHVRLGDKRGVHRSIVAVRRFTPYVKAFVDNGGSCVYLATDSLSAIHFIEKKWPASLKAAVRSQGHSIVRSVLGVSVPDMEDDHHRTNSEALVDMLALSKCDILLHGFSTVSEAAIYINPKLHNQSVNLEYQNIMSDENYQTLVKTVLKTSVS
jgi:hypothetical protein